MTSAYYTNSEYVILSPDEVKHCVDHGIEKEHDSRRRGLKNRHGCTFTPEESMFNGCIADLTEAGAALVLGWPIQLTIGTFNVPDLPGNIQVKSVKKYWGDLMIRDDAPANWRMMAVGIDLRGIKTVDDLYHYNKPLRIMGWLEAGEARRLVMDPTNYHWRTDFGNGREMVTMVPQENLRPTSGLRTILNAEGFATNTDRLFLQAEDHVIDLRRVQPSSLPFK